MKKQYPVDVETFDFKVRLDVQIRFTDIDGFGHANNSAMQSFFDLGRAAYMERVCGGGFYKNNETMLVVSYTTDFLRQVHFEDKVEMCASVYRIGNRSLSLIMALVNKETGEVCAVSDSVMSGFDQTTQKSIAILPEWRNKISQIEGKMF